MKRSYGLLLPTLLSAGVACAPTSNLTGPSSPKHDFLSAEVARFSKLLGVDVQASFTYKKETFGCTPEEVAKGCYNFGWYTAGTAMFYIPAVEEAEFTFLSDAACHEVAHAIYPWHRSDHWCLCKKAGATPTYPVPGVPGGVIECK